MKIKEIVEKEIDNLREKEQSINLPPSEYLIERILMERVAKETAKAIKEDIEILLNEISTETESEAIKGVFYDRTAEEFKNDVLKKFEERKWLE